MSEHTGESAVQRDAIYGCCGLNLLLPRGSAGRTPWEYNVDVNVGYRLAVNKDVSVSATIDVFNLFNFQAARAAQSESTHSIAPWGNRTET